MLKKLLKHEFRATGRIMLPALGALLIISVMGGLSFRIMSAQSDIFWGIRVLTGLMQGAFFLSLIAAFVLVIVLIVIRFYKSLMGDEGYLSFTLPVSVDGHLWNKIITSLVWIVAVAVVCVLSVNIYLAVGGNTALFNSTDIFGLLKTSCASYGTGNTIGYILEGLLAFLICIIAECLHFYAAIAIGGLVSKRKKLLAVGAYFILNAVKNILFLLCVPILASRGFWQLLDLSAKYENITEGIPAMHIILSGACLASAVIGVIYYFTARFCMTKKLNLA